MQRHAGSLLLLLLLAAASSSAASNDADTKPQQDQQQQQPNDVVLLTTDTFADVIERQPVPAMVRCSTSTKSSQCDKCSARHSHPVLAAWSASYAQLV